MRKSHSTSFLKCGALFLLTLNLIVSCRPGDARLSSDDSQIVKDGVTRMAANIAADVSKNGPRAWLNYFENSPGFFMATGGQLAFTDYASAKVFILHTLVKIMPHIKLKWDNLRVDPLTNDLAAIGANFHEDIPGENGVVQKFDGYFTGTAHRTGHGWKLRNLHWSFSPAPK